MNYNLAIFITKVFFTRFINSLPIFALTELQNGGFIYTYSLLIKYDFKNSKTIVS